MLITAVPWSWISRRECTFPIQRTRNPSLLSSPPFTSPSIFPFSSFYYFIIFFHFCTISFYSILLLYHPFLLYSSSPPPPLFLYSFFLFQFFLLYFHHHFLYLPFHLPHRQYNLLRDDCPLHSPNKCISKDGSHSRGKWTTWLPVLTAVLFYPHFVLLGEC